MSAVTGFEAGIIEVVVGRIVRLVAPIKVILFGSRARGDARPDSDFDLLVVRESDKPRHERSAPIYTALADLPVEVEVMVYTPAEIEEWQGVSQAFVTTAIREGKVLYERAEGPSFSANQYRRISLRKFAVIGYPEAEQITESIPHFGHRAVVPTPVPASSTQSVIADGSKTARQ